ncbi:PREDICTED: nose resistant to fluoxetine protein 6-like [Papilio polytes]|uniref:nose resistant to fluoxetine protein 6-like n=1 Tax=Papilio polytes TaxID=76194 RepID=UPI000675D506|nr:PREDICTED: nose resistant to fluoxetine protein 6-like [Papilio polytes]
MELKFLLIVITSAHLVVGQSRKHLNQDVKYHPFDQDLYRDVLDPELCQQQIQYIRNNSTLLQARFLDAGLRIPQGILLGNLIHLGSYYQCLKIKENVNEMDIQGKYCSLKVSLGDIDLLKTNKEDISTEPYHFNLDTIEDVTRIMKNVNHTRMRILNSSLKLPYSPDYDVNSRMGPGNPLSDLELTLAICIPAPCTTPEVINTIIGNLTDVGIDYKEDFCRLPNDKLWAPVDYVAVAIFSTIGLLTILSTSYDIYYSKVLVKDKRTVNSLYFCCSMYTNTRRLITFKPVPNSLDCIDGIRSLAMIWVILGHAFYAIPIHENPLEVFQWSISPNAIWMTAGHMTVDTFFLLSGLLLVYSTAGKLTGGKLIRTLHMFYLHRVLRLFPILAAMVLFEASLFNYVSDGPLWIGPAQNVLRCRQYWWSTLLHIQNFVNPINLCVGVSWYLSLDIQLHIISPIILYWVLSSRKTAAWAALTSGLMASLISATLYIFMNEFQSGIISPNRPGEGDDYFTYYYINLLTRAPPFFVGMIFGYIISSWKDKKLTSTMVIAMMFWFFCLSMFGAIFYILYINMQLDWDNQTADSFINSFVRPLWGVGLGWIIFACVKGYGGPINWFLSLHVWKLPARLSYAMYIIHFSVMVAYYNSRLAPVYFTVSSTMFNFFGFFFLTFILAFLATVIIDAPFGILVKTFLSPGSKAVKTVDKKDLDKETISSAPDRKTVAANPTFVPEGDKVLS